MPIYESAIIALPWKHDTISSCQLFKIKLIPSERRGQTLDTRPSGWFVLAKDMVEFLDVESVESGLSESASTLSLEGQSPVLIETVPHGLKLGDSTLDQIAYLLRRSGVLITGPVGSGKTHAALLTASVARFYNHYTTIYLDCRRLRDDRTTTIKKIIDELRILFSDAITFAPCTVLLDNLDEIAPSLPTQGSVHDSSRVEQVNPILVNQSKLIGDALLHFIRTAKSQKSIVLVGTCASDDAVNEAVVKAFVNGNPFKIPALSNKEREAMFVNCLDRYVNVDCEMVDVTGIGRSLDGYRPRDIERLALRVKNRLLAVDCTDFESVLREEVRAMVPMSRIGISTSTMDQSYNLSDVGGLFSAKEQLTSTIIRPARFRKIYERSQVRLPRGILLFGPSGCGKTHIVPAIANECGYQLIMCRGPELLDKYIGASEANVRELFARATAVAPSILFLDELDSLAPRRGTDRTGVTDRIVNQLLTFLDGVEDMLQGVYIIAATSRPDKIDPALLRPGRLEKHVYVGVPETIEEASDLFLSVAKHYRMDESVMNKIRSGRILDQLTPVMGEPFRMTGADFKGLCNTAQVRAAHKALQAESSEGFDITLDDIEESCRSFRLGLSVEEYERLQKIYVQFRNPRSLRDASERYPITAPLGLRTALK